MDYFLGCIKAIIKMYKEKKFIYKNNNLVKNNNLLFLYT